MNFVLSLTSEQVLFFLDYYKNEAEPSDNTHIKRVITDNELTITVYHTNKVVFQGKTAAKHALFWQEKFGLEDFKQPIKVEMHSDYYLPSIGSDESGVGDYFGPLTVCAAYVGEEHISWLKTLKIKDSKLIKDVEIKKIAVQLIEKIPYSLLILDNEKYNQMIEKGYNAHKLKAHLHAQCHKHLTKKIGLKVPIIVDQFCTEAQYKNYTKDFKGLIMPTHFQTKAESYYLSVAVASIIARYSFITKLDQLSEKIGVPLLKGASGKVDELAKFILDTKGEKTLRKIAKVHFKTTQKATQL
ncbi:ribonuclease HIII [Liberiplasma polymorphum]|uniref:ribonuclease HIII n=1 Tax=Liberiplasma polymorphum TaxID=3374570 RepID=UPI003773D6CF